MKLQGLRIHDATVEKVFQHEVTTGEYSGKKIDKYQISYKDNEGFVQTCTVTGNGVQVGDKIPVLWIGIESKSDFYVQAR